MCVFFFWRTVTKLLALAGVFEATSVDSGAGASGEEVRPTGKNVNCEFGSGGGGGIQTVRLFIFLHLYVEFSAY